VPTTANAAGSNYIRIIPNLVEAAQRANGVEALKIARIPNKVD
jgi:hypothetical protein